MRRDLYYKKEVRREFENFGNLCCMVLYDLGDHFVAKFPILPLCDSGGRFLLIGDCYLATSILYIL